MATNKANFGIGDGSGSGYFGYGTAGSAATVTTDILISSDGITATFPTHDVLKEVLVIFLFDFLFLQKCRTEAKKAPKLSVSAHSNPCPDHSLGM